MEENIADDRIWELIGYVKISSIRMNTLKSLESRFLMPSEIAKLTGYRTTQISNALRDLKEKELVRCMNEDARKGRIYQSTELGLLILNILDE